MSRENLLALTQFLEEEENSIAPVPTKDEDYVCDSSEDMSEGLDPADVVPTPTNLRKKSASRKSSSPKSSSPTGRKNYSWTLEEEMEDMSEDLDPVDVVPTPTNPRKKSTPPESSSPAGRKNRPWNEEEMEDTCEDLHHVEAVRTPTNPRKTPTSKSSPPKSSSPKSPSPTPKKNHSWTLEEEVELLKKANTYRKAWDKILYAFHNGPHYFHDIKHPKVLAARVTLLRDKFTEGSSYSKKEFSMPARARKQLSEEEYARKKKEWDDHEEFLSGMWQKGVDEMRALDQKEIILSTANKKTLDQVVNHIESNSAQRKRINAERNEALRIAAEDEKTGKKKFDEGFLNLCTKVDSMIEVVMVSQKMLAELIKKELDREERPAN